MPANSARARSPAKRAAPASSPSAAPAQPKRASGSGWRGGAAPARAASGSSRPSRGQRRHRGARSAAASRAQRSRAVVRPPSASQHDRRCRRRADAPRGTSGCSQLEPVRGERRARRKNGEASASGCTAEHTSCRKPGQGQLGRARSRRRRSSARLEHQHRAPGRAPASMAAASPFGPAPTTTASSRRSLPRRVIRRPGRSGSDQPGTVRARSCSIVRMRGVVPDVAGLAPLAAPCPRTRLGVAPGPRTPEVPRQVRRASRCQNRSSLPWPPSIRPSS